MNESGEAGGVGAYVVGITGGSGSGKSTLCRALCDRLGASAAVLSYDAYYHDLGHLSPQERAAKDYDHPDSLDTALFVSHLDAARRGEAVRVPDYNFATHTRVGSSVLTPGRVLIVEGILLGASELICARIDHLVFLECPEPIRFNRRSQRDQVERGRTPESIEEQWKRFVAPAYATFVAPVQNIAHRVVNSNHAFDEPPVGAPDAPSALDALADFVSSQLG